MEVEERKKSRRGGMDIFSLCYRYLRLGSLIAHVRLETVGIHWRPFCGSYPITSLSHLSSSMSLLVSLESCDIM